MFWRVRSQAGAARMGAPFQLRRMARYIRSVTDGTVPHGTAIAPVKTLQVSVVEGPDRGAVHRARYDRVAVGTARDNDLVLTDQTVSRYHLELSQLGDRISIIDLGSTNGTLVGPARIERATIEPETLIRIGKTTLRVADAAVVEVELFEEDALGGLRGRSTVMRKLMADIRRVAKSDASVLLTGETGCGKEAAAHAIHEASPRAQGPFETVDCGALAPTLVASELFGHEKGAFTGAESQRIGAFERANGGTLFLDEVGELPASLQAALLGAIERRTFKRVGGDRPISVDVRVVSATHRDLRAEVNNSSFRQDLYYRLAVVTMRIPPLRERTEDIPILVAHFLRQAGHSGEVEEIIPSSALAALAVHRWPGNVRELRNFVEAALAIGAVPELEPEERAAAFASEPFAEIFKKSFKEARLLAVASFEAAYVRALLERCGGNVSEAARVSQIHRSYLNEMIKRHRIRG